MKHNRIFTYSKSEIKESIIKMFEYGISKRRTSFYALRQNHFKDLDPPVFFLSTGRTGTKWFSELLKKDPYSLVFHAPKPDLSVQNTLAYKMLVMNDFQLKEEQKVLLKEIFLAGREQQLRYSFKTQKRYIETNNYITFFAPLIAELMPHSIFVHLYRHPGKFVRSGLNRKYYLNEDPGKIRRIYPVKGFYYDHWSELTQIEKIAWLWNETNEFIEKFKGSISQDRIINFNFEQLSDIEVEKMISQLNCRIRPGRIKKLLNIKVNRQKFSNDLRRFDDWNKSEKEMVLSHCRNLTQKYFNT